MHEWKQECKHISERGSCSQYDIVTDCCKSGLPGGCLPVVDQCQIAGIEEVPDPKDKEKKIQKAVPCSRIIRGNLCAVYLNPSRKWSPTSLATCPFAGKSVVAEEQKAINPLKASKRAAGKKG